MKTTRAIEDYLETLLMMEEAGERLDVTGLANRLSISKPATTQMLSELKALRYIEKEKYGDINLTELGREIGEKTLHKHRVLKKFLIDLGIPEEIAEEDCCKIEHVISDLTFETIEAKVNMK